MGGMRKQTVWVTAPLWAFLMVLISFLPLSCRSDRKEDLPAGPRVLAADSQLARDSYATLEVFLKEKRPDIVPTFLESIWSADAAGSEVVLVCAYRERGRDFWLRAILTRDSRGRQRVSKVVFAWEYDRSGEFNP